MPEEVVTWFNSISDMLKWVVGLGTSVGVIYKWIIKPVKKMQEAQEQTNARIIKELSEVKDTLSTVQDDVADTLGDRLGQAYRHFIRQGWCSFEEKKYFIDLHKRYTGKGHNHLADTYEKDLLALPEYPPVEVKHVVEKESLVQ